ncbi:hypothetical protein LSTR_LSTR014856, partial [Laodelphax striatellus]
MENCADKSAMADGVSEQNQVEVKSTAIVKYSAIQPAKFAQLQCNTDLNLPPANWLSSSVESYGFQHVLSNSGAFSSFRMAHMFPDCMGEVDVVSDAENVKKLLKIPYSRGSVSMMVHRIENTLLIDEFDIHKHLIRQAESDWVWLRKFFFEHVLQSLGDKDKGVTLRNHSRCALQQKYLTSKFLHYSLAETSDKTQENRENQNTRPPSSRNEPPLPEPSLEEEVPDPATNKTFARNVVWTFEDIQMLLGTDMPIFGGSTHPCISLRLRDMTKPISVLTGIDYWLDNLMCNVPEVMMCYHLDGIVQRYELIKTEDLPHLSGSKFSPKLILYVTLAEQEYNCGNYGVALRYIHCVLRYMSNFFGKNSALTSYLLGRAGDCCLLLAKNWVDIEKHFAGYTTKSDIDVEIEEAICKKGSDDNEDCKLMPKVMENVGQMLVVGCQFYSRALVLAPCDNLRRRLGNIHNEIGSYYMNQAAAAQTTPPTNNEERLKYDNLFKAARSHLEQGVEQFESVSDNANLALLHSNTGRLMRLLAHYQQHCHQFDGEQDEDKIAARVSKGEKYYYNRAFSSYQKALGFLGGRKSNPLIWDTINWELSSALFAYATMMQDYPPPISARTREEVEREVVELMQKALKFCDVDTPGPKQPMYQYRAGMLHYRLACLYHKTYRNLVADENSSRRKNVLQLCTMNYEKAARILLAIEYPSDYLRVQLERVALLEFQAENSNGALMKIKHYQNAITILV